jgi:hypothetical protein
MSVFERIAEDRIQKAKEEGLFDNLEGTGQPFHFEDDSFVPEDLRLAYKILKNSNCLPPEVELRRQVFSLRQLLETTVDPDERRKILRNLNLITLSLDVRR